MRAATGTQLYSPATGDELSGWTVRAVYIRPLNLSQQDLIRTGGEAVLGTRCATLCHAAPPQAMPCTRCALAQRRPAVARSAHSRCAAAAAPALLPTSSGSTFSAAGDPYPLNPASDNQTAFVGLLWQNGAEIFIEVDRCGRHSVRSWHWRCRAALPPCAPTQSTHPTPQPHTRLCPGPPPPHTHTHTHSRPTRSCPQDLHILHHHRHPAHRYQHSAGPARLLRVAAPSGHAPGHRGHALPVSPPTGAGPGTALLPVQGHARRSCLCNASAGSHACAMPGSILFHVCLHCLGAPHAPHAPAQGDVPAPRLAPPRRQLASRHLPTGRCTPSVCPSRRSLTALQFVLSSGLPSSSTVVPTQQLIIVRKIFCACFRETVHFSTLET